MSGQGSKGAGEAAAITIEPLGGLGNRMRAIDSALALSRRLAVPLHVTWTVRSHMPARFDELFEVPAAFASLSQPRDPRALRPLRLWRARRRHERFIDEAEASTLVRAGADFSALPGGVPAPGRLLVRTHERFHPNARPFADFVPAGAIRAMLARHAPLLPRLVGVHIRRQDNRQAIARSGTAAFVAAMRAELDRDPGCGFFLATDDAGEERALRAEFGERVHVHAKSTLRRSDHAAALDAVVDLYCLAGCRRIIGSYYSSFTDTAAAIHGAPLAVIGAAQ